MLSPRGVGCDIGKTGRKTGKAGENGSGKTDRGGEIGQPELRDFSASHVRSANSASWLVVLHAGVVLRPFLGRPRTQCRPNCSEIA